MGNFYTFPTVVSWSIQGLHTFELVWPLPMKSAAMQRHDTAVCHTGHPAWKIWLHLYMKNHLARAFHTCTKPRNCNAHAEKSTPGIAGFCAPNSRMARDVHRTTRTLVTARGSIASCFTNYNLCVELCMLESAWIPSIPIWVSLAFPVYEWFQGIPNGFPPWIAPKRTSNRPGRILWQCRKAAIFVRNGTGKPKFLFWHVLTDAKHWCRWSAIVLNMPLLITTLDFLISRLLGEKNMVNHGEPVHLWKWTSVTAPSWTASLSVINHPFSIINLVSHEKPWSATLVLIIIKHNQPLFTMIQYHSPWITIIHHPKNCIIYHDFSHHQPGGFHGYMMGGSPGLLSGNTSGCCAPLASPVATNAQVPSAKEPETKLLALKCRLHKKRICGYNEPKVMMIIDCGQSMVSEPKVMIIIDCGSSMVQWWIKISISSHWMTMVKW